MPQLNYSLAADHRLATIHNRSRAYFSLDMCWPQNNLAVEYDSDEHHLDARRHASDNDKKAALGQMGYRVISISTEQAGRTVMTDDAVMRVASHLGVRNREGSCSYDWQSRRSTLRRRLRDLAINGLDWSKLDHSDRTS